MDDILAAYKEAFKNFMKLIKVFMKSQGFTTKNNNFYKRHPKGNIGVIHFQKSVRSIGTFYINVGVYSVSLAERFLEKYPLEEYLYKKREVKRHPSEVDCHWRNRIRELIPMKNPDYERVKKGQWECDYDGDIEVLCTEICYLIASYAIPAIDDRMTDQ